MNILQGRHVAYEHTVPMIHRRPLVAVIVLAVAACVHAKPALPPSERAATPSVPKPPSCRFVSSGRGAMQGTALEGGRSA
jgi:hypothetical protein